MVVLVLAEGQGDGLGLELLPAGRVFPDGEVEAQGVAIELLGTLEVRDVDGDEVDGADVHAAAPFMLR